jgi:hypothetical protein
MTKLEVYPRQTVSMTHERHVDEHSVESFKPATLFLLVAEPFKENT